MLQVVAILALVCALGAGFVPVAESAGYNQTQASDEPAIVEVYPNPPTYGDTGEFVTVEFPPGANVSAYALADDHRKVSLKLEGNRTVVEERTEITFSTARNQTKALTNRTVQPLSDRIRLADRGDRLRLFRDGTLVDTVQYGRATEAEVYNATRDEWHPLGATDRPAIGATGGEIEAFVLPDEPDRAVEFLESASERIYLAGYTLSSQRVVEALTDAHEAGVTVEVLVDGSPVGGMSGHAAAALDELDREGIDVRVIEGDYDRYRFHHAKYAVVDGEALVTSENWKPSGTGGRSSRGWAVITDQQPIVEGLVETFHADTGWVDAISWNEFDDVTLVENSRASGAYPREFKIETLRADRTELLVAPDNAEEQIHSAIRNAETSLDIKQVQISDQQFPLLQAVIEAAERGVEVRILLSGVWYARAENEQFKAWLEDQAEAGELPLEVRIADPGNAFEKIHAKGLIVDGEQTLVGSINWNNNSVQNNREVALLIESREVAAYFGDVFEADWQRDDKQELPLGLALVALLVAVLAVLGASRVQFE